MIKLLFLLLMLPGVHLCGQNPVYIWVEGESAGPESKVTRHPWWYDQVKNEEFSGKDFISNWSADAPGFATYSFTVPEAGEYTLWLRANATQASMTVKLNGKADSQVPMAQAQENLNVAKRGVNLLRLHGAVFDNQTGELKPDAVARLQEVTARAKKEGIYTHYSIYFPLWFEPKPGLEFLEGYDGKSKPFASLQGTDSIVHFVHDSAQWAVKPRFWMQPWTLMSPSQMGQFPATALLYRMGYIDEGKTLAHVGLEKEDLFALKGTPLVQKGNLDEWSD